MLTNTPLSEESLAEMRQRKKALQTTTGKRSSMSLLSLSLVFLAAHLATALWFVLDRSPGTAAALLGFPLDDAWIHMVYARSLAALQGFAYNPGQLETGSTSPLWGIVLIPASWIARALHFGVVVPAKITTLLAAVGASLAAARLLRGLGFGMAVQIAAGLVIAADPALAFAQVSGMEIMLSSALALWAFSELAHERYRLAGIAAALAPLARPEMAILTMLVLATALWRQHVAKVSWKTRLWVLLPTVVAVGGWMTYCLAVTGYPLPSTFYAKFAASEDHVFHNLILISTEVLPASPWFAWGTGTVLWFLGAAAVWRRGPVGKMVVVFPLLFFLGVSASQPLKSAWPFYFLRYVLPAQVFVVTTVAAGAVILVDWAWKRRRLAFAPAYAIGVGALVVGSLARLPSALVERAHLFAWNCQNIEELNVAMAIWLRDNVPPGESIVVNDAGAARYFGEHPILDIVGLNHHRWLHREPRAGIELAQARYAALFPSLIPQIANDPGWQPIHRTSTQNLTICRCDQSEIVAFRRTPPLP
jgi:hypothetical protein